MSRLTQDNPNPLRCKQMVWDTGRWPRQHQCSRSPGEDGYCRQHTPDAVAARKAEVDRRYREQIENSDSAKLERARARIFRLRTALQVILDNGSGVAVGLAQEALEKDK